MFVLSKLTEILSSEILVLLIAYLQRTHLKWLCLLFKKVNFVN